MSSLIAAGRVITPGYKGPRFCHGCPRVVADGEILFDLDLSGPLNPDLCLGCVTAIWQQAQEFARAHQRDAVRSMYDYLAGELAGLRIGGGGARATH